MLVPEGGVGFQTPIENKQLIDFYDRSELEKRRKRGFHTRNTHTGFSADDLAHTELSGDTYALHNPGSLMRTFPTRGSTGYAIISLAS